MDKPLTVATEAERWHRFGRFVRTYREDTARLSQGQAAAAAGMTRQQWNRIERGSSGSKRPTIIKIAGALQADPLPFLEAAGFTEPGFTAQAGPATEIEERRLIRFFRELPEECQEDVMALTEALWRRRRAEGRAERIEQKAGGKISPETVKPGVPKKSGKRRAS